MPNRRKKVIVSLNEREKFANLALSTKWQAFIGGNIKKSNSIFFTVPLIPDNFNADRQVQLVMKFLFLHQKRTKSKSRWAILYTVYIKYIPDRAI